MDQFIPCYTTYSALNMANLYFREVVRLHGIPRSIASYGDIKFFKLLMAYNVEKHGHSA